MKDQELMRLLREGDKRPILKCTINLTINQDN